MKCGRLVRLWGNRTLISAVFVLCFPFPLPSVTEWPRTTLSTLTDTMTEKHHYSHSLSLLFIGLCAWSLSRTPSMHKFDVFYSADVTAVQARRKHPHIPLMRSSHARFSGSASEALSSSSLCHCWHLQSFCYCVCVGFVGRILSLRKAGFEMVLRTSSMVHAYKVQLMPDVKWMASHKAQLLVDVCISYAPWQQRCKPSVLMCFPSL